MALGRWGGGEVCGGGAGSGSGGVGGGGTGRAHELLSLSQRGMSRGPVGGEHGAGGGGGDW